VTHPSFADLFSAFWRIGIYSFGGPAAQIAVMHRELVDDRKWLTERQFLNALSFCMLLPGPEAMQLSTYAGWKLAGWRGGLLAGLLFVLPGAAVIFALAALYVSFGNVPLVTGIFFGIKAAVLVIVLQALLKVARKALAGATGWAIALTAFVALYFLAIPYPLIVLAAAGIGFFVLAEDDAPPTDVARPPFRQSAGTVVIWLALWFLPLAVLWWSLPGHILTQIGLFFSQLAVVTFGGAYAVLAWIAQDVVTEFGWLTASEMIDALGLAETTPGPLILVTQFVGFLAAASGQNIWLGMAGGAVALWATFVPCFLWIFAGAPYIEWISAQPRLRGALNGITAAVVGVIANLSIWFAIHVLFGHVTRIEQGPLSFTWPTIATWLPAAWLLFLIAAAMAFIFKWGMGRVLLASGVLGVLTVQFLSF
jgi:chromate transporter